MTPPESNEIPSQAREAAIRHFSEKLEFETDPSDVAAERLAGNPLILIDVRSEAAWNQGHIPGALHIPARELTDRIGEIPEGDIVVYCWGPACNGSTKAALTLSRLGRFVKEMIGGFEYWAREGLAVETSQGRTRRPVDDLTAPISSPAP